MHVVTDCGSCILYKDGFPGQENLSDDESYQFTITYLNVMLDNSFTQNKADLNYDSVLNLQVDSFRCWYVCCQETEKVMQDKIQNSWVIQ